MRTLHHRRLITGAHSFFRRLRRLVGQPIFIVLTIVGNLAIFSGATVLYYLEKDSNPAIKTLLDTVWWAVATVTTVGYGDITPTTNIGKIVGIGMMIVGTALFWSFTALFAQALLAEEISEVEDELKAIEKILKTLDRNKNFKDEQLEPLLKELQKHIQT